MEDKNSFRLNSVTEWYDEYTPTSGGGGNSIVCAWCLKTGLKLFTLKTPSGETKEFCSETCFNQCRRAAFKKNRVCNWCRHVRHTVNYVDFQDGDDQLQFCGDKCLNQYKMQIFCRETQAYLQMNPHLQEENPPAHSKLITPELWMRDCQQEPSNGAASSSGDERLGQEPSESAASKSERSPLSSRNYLQRLSDRQEPLEDLSVTSKSERNPLSSRSYLQRLSDRQELLEDLSAKSKSERNPLSGRSYLQRLSDRQELLEDLSAASKPERNPLLNRSYLQRLSDRQELLEDLSAAPKSEHSPLSNRSYLPDRESLKTADDLSGNCDTFASFRDEKRDKERRKRHHETGREGHRKRQRVPSFRNKAEIPPAHSSSAPSTLSFQKHCPLFPSACLRSKSPVRASPPAAHSKSFAPHPVLPPPPPLLSNDYYHHPPFHPQVLTSHQPQLDALLRMQAGFGQNPPFPESMLLRAQQHPRPNAVMFPFPVFVPLPVPIPVPLPLRSFLPKEMEESTTSRGQECGTDEAKNSRSEDSSSARTPPESDLSEKGTKKR